MCGRVLISEKLSFYWLRVQTREPDCLGSSPSSSKLSLKVKVLVAQSCLTLCDPWTVAHQPPLSTAFPRQEYWSGLPFPPPGGLPDPGVKPQSPALQADSLLSHLGSPTCHYLTSISSSVNWE